jgi:hypothetical protein
MPGVALCGARMGMQALYMNPSNIFYTNIITITCDYTAVTPARSQLLALIIVAKLHASYKFLQASINIQVADNAFLDPTRKTLYHFNILGRQIMPIP